MASSLDIKWKICFNLIIFKLDTDGQNEYPSKVMYIDYNYSMRLGSTYNNLNFSMNLKEKEKLCQTVKIMALSSGNIPRKAFSSFLIYFPSFYYFFS